MKPYLRTETPPRPQFAVRPRGGYCRARAGAPSCDQGDRMAVHRTSLLLVTLHRGAMLSAGPAGAQDFQYGKREPLKGEVEWKASASAGLILTTGNSRALAFSGSALISRRDGDDKVTLEGA